MRKIEAIRRAKIAIAKLAIKIDRKGRDKRSHTYAAYGRELRALGADCARAGATDYAIRCMDAVAGLKLTGRF